MPGMLGAAISKNLLPPRGFHGHTPHSSEEEGTTKEGARNLEHEKAIHRFGRFSQILKVARSICENLRNLWIFVFQCWHPNCTRIAARPFVLFAPFVVLHWVAAESRAKFFASSAV